MTTQNYIDLTGSAAARKRVADLAASFGVELVALPAPASIEALEESIDAQKPAFLFVQPDSVFVSRGLKIRAVSDPPTLALVARQPGPQAQELLRGRGISAAITPHREPGEASMLRALCDSPNWLRVRSSSMHLAQLLQSLEPVGSRVVLVADKRAGRVFTEDWKRLRGVDSFGRIYISEGQVQRVEIPGMTGKLALAQLLEQHDARVVVQQVAIEPQRADMNASIQGALMSAAVAQDHQPATESRRTGVPQTRPPKPVKTFSRRSVPVPPPPRVASNAQRPHKTIPVPATAPAPAMTPSTIKPPKSALTSLLDKHDKVKGAAVCDVGGVVRDVAGAIDAETRAAAAEMARPGVGSVGVMLGLGEATGLVIETDSESALVTYSGRKVVVASGGVGGNALDLLRELDRVAAGDS